MISTKHNDNQFRTEWRVGMECFDHADRGKVINIAREKDFT